MLCRKCSKLAWINGRQKDPFCQKCFSAYIEHKYKLFFGKHNVPKNSRLLCVISDDISSRFLHYITQSCIKRNSLQIIPTYVYIATNASSFKEKCDDQFIIYFPAIIAGEFYAHDHDSFRQYMDSIYMTRHEETCKLFFKYLSDFKYPFTSNLSDVICQNAIIKACMQLQILVVLCSDISNTNAHKTLANTILGSGKQMAFEAANICVKNHIKFCKPLKDLSLKEVVYYLYINGIDTSTIVNPYFSKDLVNTDVECITQDFFQDLSRDFPSITNAVNRFAAKIYQHDSFDPEKRTTCDFCLDYLETEGHEVYVSRTDNANKRYVCFKCFTLLSPLIENNFTRTLLNNWFCK